MPNYIKPISDKQVVIFTDLDGTLLDHHSYELEQARPVINQLTDKNIPIVINTSKTFDEVVALQKEQQLTGPFIIENGAAVYMPIGELEQMPEGCEEKSGYWCKTFCHDRSYWLDLLKDHAGQFAGAYQGFSDLSIDELCQLTGLSPEKAQLALTRNYGEPIHWRADDDTKASFIEHLTGLGANILQGGRFIHVSGDCDKGQAQQWLVEQYRNNQDNNPQSEQTVEFCSIALGDSGNDIAMLEAADIAVQVKNPEHDFPVLTRQEQVYQTQQFGPAGWAEALSKLVFNQ